jgi:hypothetical protein
VKIAFEKTGLNYDLSYNQEAITAKDLFVGKLIVLPILQTAVTFCDNQQHSKFSKQLVLYSCIGLANTARVVLGSLETITKVALAVITLPALIFHKKLPLQILQSAIYNFFFVKKMEIKYAIAAK